MQKLSSVLYKNLTIALLCSSAIVSQAEAGLVRLDGYTILSTGQGTNAGGPVPANSSLQYNFTFPSTTTNVSADIDFNINAIDLNGKIPGFLTLTSGKTVSIGSVIDTLGLHMDTERRLKLFMPSNATVTLTGTGASAAQDGFDASENDYSALYLIDFARAPSTLNIATSDYTSIDAIFSNASFGTLKISTTSSIALYDPSAISVGIIDFVGNAGKLSLPGSQDQESSLSVYSKFTNASNASVRLSAGSNYKFMNSTGDLGTLELLGNTVSFFSLDGKLSDIYLKNSSKSRANIKFYGDVTLTKLPSESFNFFVNKKVQLSLGVFPFVTPENIVANDTIASTVILKPQNNAIVQNIPSVVYLTHDDSVLTLDSSDLGEDWLSQNSFLGIAGADDTGESLAPKDKRGVLNINAVNNKITLKSLGNLPVIGFPDPSGLTRIKKLSINGNADVNLHAVVNAAHVEFNNSAIVSFINDTIMGEPYAHNLGDAAVIDILQDTKLAVTSSLIASSPTINLGTNEFALNSGSAIFSGAVVINTSFDSTTQKSGHILVGDSGGNSLAFFDLASADTVTVKFTGDNALLPIGQQYKYTLFVAEDGGVANVDHSKIVFDGSGEQNKYLQWEYQLGDVETMIVSTTNFDALTNSDNPIASELGNSAQTNLDSLSVVSDLGSMSADQEAYALNQMQPNDGSMVAQQEGRDANEGQLSSRLLAIAAPDNINYEQDGQIIGAGSGEITGKYGAWVSPAWHKAKQGKSGKNTGYDLTSMGVTLGFDNMINEQTTLGLAWSISKSDIGHQGAWGKDKSKTTQNIFSAYGWVDISDSMFVNGIFSFGMGSTKNHEYRILTKNSTAIAEAKYDSKLYNAQFMAGKKFYMSGGNKIVPMIGLRHTMFSDDAYQESGAGLQSLKVGKKENNVTELVVGARASKPYMYEDWLLKPEIFTMAYVNLYETLPVTKISSDIFNAPIELKGIKNNKVWYALGTMLDATKGSMQYIARYELQLDKKYVGHQVALNLRVNF
jgi:outer membrane autotransporter protein